MSVLGVGPLELLVVLVVALLVVGPEGLVKFARRLGGWLRRLRQNPFWQEATRVSYELQHWQDHLLRESGLWDIRQRDPNAWSWHTPPPWQSKPPAPFVEAEMPPPATNPPPGQEDANEEVGSNGAGGSRTSQGSPPESRGNRT